MTHLRNNIVNKLFHTTTGHRIILIAISMLLSLWVSTIFKLPTANPDEGTYLTAGNVFFSGHIDGLRTPVYPVICYIFTSLFNFKGLYVIVALQLLVMYISIIYMHRATMLITQRRSLQFIATALYAWNTPLLSQSFAILTESLATSMLVMLLYFTIAIAQGKASRKQSIAAPLLWVVLVLLRPFSLCFLPMLIFAYIYAAHHKHFKWAKHSLSALAASIAILLGYCSLFYAEHHRFTLTDVSMLNHAQMCHSKPFTNSYRIYLADGDSTKLIPTWRIDYSDPELFEKLDFKKDILPYATQQITIYDVSTDSPYPEFTTPIIYTYTMTLHCLSLGQIYLILYIIAILQLYLFYRLRRIDIVVTLLLLSCALTFFTVFAGNDGRCIARLQQPLFPALCMLAAAVPNQLNLHLVGADNDKSKKQ